MRPGTTLVLAILLGLILIAGALQLFFLRVRRSPPAASTGELRPSRHDPRSPPSAAGRVVKRLAPPRTRMKATIQITAADGDGDREGHEEQAR